MNRLEWKKLIEDLYPNKTDRKEVMVLLRLALTGQFVGPDLYLAMEILGYDKVRQRFFDFLKHYNLCPCSDNGSTLPL
jgi:glutamyl/glutaminyl-tRNA synthetase